MAAEWAVERVGRCPSGRAKGNRSVALRASEGARPESRGARGKADLPGAGDAGDGLGARRGFAVSALVQGHPLRSAWAGVPKLGPRA